MKKLFVLSLLFIMTKTYSQPSIFVSQLNQDFKGFVIMENNDTIKGDIRMMPQWQMQMNPALTAYDKKYYNCNARYSKYYELENGTKWFSTRFTVLKAPEDKERAGGKDWDTYVLIDVVGPITLFTYDFLDTSVPPNKENVKTYMQTPSGEVVDVSGFLMGYAKKMSVYLNDYPELAAKVTNKEKGYGFLNINNVIKEYNKWYLEKHPEFSIWKK